MKPINHFIVHIPKKFQDEIKFNGGKIEIISKYNEFEYRVNSGEIISVPKGFDEDCIGSTMYFHHHVVIEQRYDIGENLYLVQYEADGGYGNHAVAIEDEDGDITMLGDWCFVLPPVEPKEEKSSSGIILSIKEKPELEGILFAIHKDSEWIGVKTGDIVGYTENSEYKMDLKNATVYRMRSKELVYVKEA